jgi:predicted RecB family endonuclease
LASQLIVEITIIISDDVIITFDDLIIIFDDAAPPNGGAVNPSYRQTARRAV